MNMIISLNNDSGFFKDNVSSYKGVKTDASSASGNSSYEKESTNDVTGTDSSVVVDARELKDVKVQTNFEWKEGGSHIYLTGSFCNWNQKFLMTQNVLGNKFEINLVRFFSVILPFLMLFYYFMLIYNFFFIFYKKNFNFRFLGIA